MGQRHPLRILLAEDSPINQTVELGLLARMGYTADVAANGREAVDAVWRQGYDVVLMDIEMPEMDGIEAAAAIRETLPKERQPRVIAITAHALFGDRERFLAAGMDDYVTKPVRIEHLAAALRRCAATAASAPPEPAPMPAARGEPAVVVDEGLLAEIREITAGTGPQAFDELVSIFADYAAQQLAAMAAAAERDDAEALRQAAHALRSSSGNLGAVRLRELCRQAERAAAQGDTAAAAAALPEMRAARVELLAALGRDAASIA